MNLRGHAKSVEKIKEALQNVKDKKNLLCNIPFIDKHYNKIYNVTKSIFSVCS